jgi:hypothetical protein
MALATKTSLVKKKPSSLVISGFPPQPSFASLTTLHTNLLHQLLLLNIPTGIGRTLNRPQGPLLNTNAYFSGESSWPWIAQATRTTRSIVVLQRRNGGERDADGIDTGSCILYRETLRRPGNNAIEEQELPVDILDAVHYRDR